MPCSVSCGNRPGMGASVLLLCFMGTMAIKVCGHLSKILMFTCHSAETGAELEAVPVMPSLLVDGNFK